MALLARPLLGRQAGVAFQLGVRAWMDGNGCGCQWECAARCAPGYKRLACVQQLLDARLVAGSRGQHERGHVVTLLREGRGDQVGVLLAVSRPGQPARRAGQTHRAVAQVDELQLPGAAADVQQQL